LLNPARGVVAVEMPGINPSQFQVLEAEAQDLARGFRAVSFAPKRNANPF
jgi:hypothetical protein